jgi:hypothetical protein
METNPSEPCPHPAGSEAKIRVLVLRRGHGYHPM